MKTQDHPVSQDHIVELLLQTITLRDPDTAGHSYRVSQLAIQLGSAIGLAEQDLISLRYGALLHDIGKLGVPEFILFKPGVLSEQEQNSIRRHPDYGAELVYPIPFLKHAHPIIKYHHERWNGTGYPQKLKGTAIPLLARICAVAEVFDALTNDQVYRPAWSVDRTLEWVQQETEHAFDPAIATILRQVI